MTDSNSSAQDGGRRLPAVVHGIAVFLFFLGMILYPFVGSRGSNLLAALILLAYVGGKTFLHRPLRALQSWLEPREAVKNVLLGTLSIVVCFGGIEMLGHIVTRAGWVEPYSAMRSQLPQGVGDFRQFHITADEFRMPDPVLLWRPVGRWPYNRQHMKGPEAEIPKPAGLIRIMSFGDSNTDGPLSGTWSEQLQAVLAERFPGQRFEVINAGVAGYSSHQGLLRFRQVVEDFAPDLVFVSFGWNDAAPAVNGPDIGYEPPAAWQVQTERFLLNYRFFQALLTLQQPDPDREEKPADVDFPPRVSLEGYRDNLQAFYDLGRETSTVTVFLTRPYTAERARMVKAPRNMRSRVPSYNDVVRSFGDETGAPMLDVRDRFAVEKIDVEPFFADDNHFSERGQLAMAEFLADELVGRGLLPVPSWEAVDRPAPEASDDEAQAETQNPS